ncbi:MAG: hypothetical protein IT443_12810 [Phycisphaeraceae bacterium]|nr:hypothetical protein [Phycisphaeraceae bacterium]
MDWRFFHEPTFYACLVASIAAMYPRAMYIIRKRRAGLTGQQIKPTISEQACLLIPAACVVFALFGLASVGAALLLAMIAVAALIAWVFLLD